MILLAMKIVENYLPVFVEKLGESSEISLTFDHEEAFKDKTLLYIQHLPPIIQVGVIMYEKTADKSRRTFFLPEVDCV